MMTQFHHQPSKSFTLGLLVCDKWSKECNINTASYNLYYDIQEINKNKVQTTIIFTLDASDRKKERKKEEKKTKINTGKIIQLN